MVFAVFILIECWEKLPLVMSSFRKTFLRFTVGFGINVWSHKLLLESQKPRTIFRSVSGLLELGKCFHRRKQLLSFSTRTEIIGTDLIFKILQEIFVSWYNLFQPFFNKIFSNLMNKHAYLFTNCSVYKVYPKKMFDVFNKFSSMI